jgi:pSer/pThr/pTyr-binding forkhead associated (FHA) protein
MTAYPSPGVHHESHVWFNARVGARLISTRDAGKVIELAGHTVTLGRAIDCEIHIADERISTRHCCLTGHDGVWAIQDLKSTNRTFLNGQPVGEQPRRLGHGDLVRLGAQDALLFEARFVIDERVAAPREAQVDDEPLRRKITELQAALLERNAEIVRLSAMCKELQSQRSAQVVASTAADRANARMTSELDALRAELEHESTERAASRDVAERMQQHTAMLESRFEAQQRKFRSELNDSNLRCKELESKLRMAMSELAAAKESLAVASDNIRTLSQAYDDARAHLELVETQSADSRDPSA